jgi:FtsP/CotA-like multicopper oxidase with cupredoxin domain
MAACSASVMPSSYSMMEMGVPDYGGGPVGRAPHRNLDALQAPDRAPDALFTLTAAMGYQAIGGIRQRVMTFNGSTPGPTLRATQGDLVEVRLTNQDVARGVTIHWHGVDLVGSQDGVAGVTQNAVLPGEEFVYRFVVPDAGTYWYHAHQDSVREVRMGLIGALVIQPSPSDAFVESAPTSDLLALVHTYGTVTTLNGAAGSTYVPVVAGTTRVRFVNSNNGPALVSATQPFIVAAIDGFDIPGGTMLSNNYVDVPAGGRVDLLVTVSSQNTRVGLLSGPSLVIGPDGSGAAPELSSSARFDALTYGTPGGSAQALSALGPPQRNFTYRIGSRSGFLNGRAGTWFTINAKIIPKVPIYMVRDGDVVRFTIVNRTPFLVHPMHLHGHHALVVSRNGQPATGAPWWVDSLEVLPGETYEIVLKADNPGAWMFHCHNLPHARAGLVTHMMYEGVHSQYLIGRVTNRLTNQPE